MNDELQEAYEEDRRATLLYRRHNSAHNQHKMYQAQDRLDEEKQRAKVWLRPKDANGDHPYWSSYSG